MIDPENGAVESFDDETAEQGTLFGAVEEFDVTHREWREMPEFVQEDLSPWKSIAVHFESRSDMEAFSRLVGQSLTAKTQSVWYPKAEILRMADKRYADEP